ncbi:MAG: MraY family glycosyltransferase [Desulfosoma sp.]
MFLIYQLCLSAVLTTTLMPVFLKSGARLGLMDKPGGRHIHERPVPRVGGMAMALGIALSLALLNRDVPLLRGLFAGGLILLVSGTADDRWDLDYRLKLLCQCLAVGAAVWLSGLRLGGLGQILPGTSIALGVMDFPATAFFLLIAINSVNLADGLDGLASGLCLLVLTAVAILSFAENNPRPLPVALATAGAITGFLRYNSHPAQVFMGDAGSQVLGFLVGMSLLVYHEGRGTPNPALLLFLLGVPALDTACVMIQRILEGQPLFQADRNHLHHILLRRGLTHEHAVIALYGLQVLCMALAIFLARLPTYPVFVLMLVLFALFVSGVLAFARMPFDPLLRFLNRKVLLRLESPTETAVSRARRVIAKVLSAGSLGALAAFLLVGPLWVRPIPHEIGLLAGALAAAVCAGRLFSPSTLEFMVKLGAYFCGLYYVSRLGFAFREGVWGMEQLWLYNRLFHIMGLCYFTALTLDPKTVPLASSDYLLGGIALLLFLIPSDLLKIYRLHDMGARIFVLFLCLQSAWYRTRHRPDLLLVPVAASLGLMALLAYWPWIF